MRPLAYARDGSLVRVVAIRAGRGLSRRLRELGVVEGGLLRVVKSQGPGPVIIEVIDGLLRDACEGFPHSSGFRAVGGRLFLGFGAAMKIIVEEVGLHGW